MALQACRVDAKSKMNGAMPARFSGKVVLITGGGGGIGRAAAERFASEGARVALVDLAPAALAESAAAVEKAGGEVLTVHADVTRLADVERYAETAVKRFGVIDVFFNNAGVLGAVKPLVDYPEETFDRVMAVNVKAVWLGMKVVAPLMRARGGGAIVNTASIAGLRGSPNIIAYTASKHAVVGLTRAASLELARHGIRVNAVCPAPIETPMARQLEVDVKRERLTATIPLRRYGAPGEVAALVAFLASADAAYITGAIYTVDGGAMA
jgi:NAD(P)-dependent dehydrogenase (short-subunit alcohol dehydrogenase family)